MNRAPVIHTRNIRTILEPENQCIICKRLNGLSALLLTQSFDELWINRCISVQFQPMYQVA